MNNEVSISLLETTDVTTKVKCQLPGQGVDVWRDFEFVATFHVQDEDEQEAVPLGATKREILRDVLKSVAGVPEQKIKRGDDEVTLTPVEVVIANAFLSDAAFAAYQLLLGKNSRDINAAAAMATVTKGNSKRSRVR